MLYREIIAVCSQIHTKHTNTPCGQNVELLHVEPGDFLTLASARTHHARTHTHSLSLSLSLSLSIYHSLYIFYMAPQ